MDSDLNLFLSLHPLARRQDENFTTASFVYLLMHLRRQYPGVLAKVLSKLGGEGCAFKAEDASQAQFVLWESTGDRIPDLRVTAPGKVMIVEVKVSHGVNQAQLDQYLDLLAESEAPQRRLALLTRYPVDVVIPSEVNTVRWYELAEILEQESPACISQPTAFLLNQFLGFIYAQSLMVAQVRSGISSDLRTYQRAHPRDSIFQLRRIRSLSRLLPFPELRSLHDFLLMLEELLQRLDVKPRPRLDSGQQERGWIGYSTPGLRYFLYVRLAEPDVLRFQLYKAPINAAAFDRSLGQLKRADSRLTWVNQIDLASSELGFFSMSRADQLRVLEDFFTTSTKFADALEAASR